MTAHHTLTVLDHPLVRHKLGLLRAVGTPTKLFRELVDEIASLLAWEVTRDMEEEDVAVDTPLERMTARRLRGKKPVVVPVLRAGLGMVDGMLRVMPNARVGHIGMARDEVSLRPGEYYFKVPPGLAERRVIVVDPMLATGGSASAAVAGLRARGAVHVTVACIVAAPEGVVAMAKAHPDVRVFAAALDRELNGVGYIVPGLGDAGDRLYGTKEGGGV
jgi:uracil phosphoribosyltransferase